MSTDLTVPDRSSPAARSASVAGSPHPGGARPRLVGRDDELEALVRCLELREPAVVDVTGARGAGKTTLVDVALDAASTSFTAVRRLDLTGETATTALAGLRRHLARLPIPLPRGPSDRPDRWTLLRLDRADVLAPVAGALADLVAEHPGVSVVVESVPPLRAPGIRVIEVGALHPAAAAELLRRAADAVGVALNSDQRTRADVDRVCAAVDGNPLAVELAAARLPVVPLGSLASVLEAPGRALSVLSRPGAGPADGRTIRTDLADSHRATSAPAQRLLDVLSVFGGSFTLEAVEAVSSGAGPCFDALGELLDLRLVELEGGPGGERYRLRRLVRDFASERLAASGGEQEARARHAAYFCDVAGRAAAAVADADEDRARAVLDEDYPEALVALRWLREHHADGALRLAADLGWEAERRGAGAALVEHLEELTRAPVGTPAARRDALVWLVQLSSWSPLAGDRVGVIREQLSEAIALARTVGEPLALLRALRTQFLAVAAHGDLAAATEACRDGMELAAAIGHPRWLGRFEISLAAMHAVVRRYDVAGELGSSGLARAVRSGDRRGIALGSLLLHGVPAEHVADRAGVPPLEAVLEIFRAHGDLQNELHTLATLAHQAIDRGDPRAAAAWVLARRDRLGRTDLVNGLTVSVMLAVHVSRLRGDHAVGARLHGAVASHMEPLLAIIAPPHVEQYRSGLRTLRESLGAERFEAEVARGRLLDREETLVELVGYLRDVVGEPGPVAAGSVGSAPSPRSAPSASSPRPASAPTRPDPGLTPREQQVLHLLEQGLRNKEIAIALAITPKSVMHHTVSIYRKLGVRSRTEAVALAARQGRLPTD
ncbi:hypothetical protein N866_02980 [Actinotalea ferrariae CF5-4]|uniref:HTH luxR-type domain-containing protein n=1 Tax=Actinotalea ferrariae CF5-4 TaxID=948458 RepID=A0A021VVJ6_9CELL|nr:LuxR C-terminal-related transcriptional regulator [Actinotalea ferrariae]EYR63092.1 hypothetical protein N866_02980 [Actinotalea ferrariae CF5-4]